MLDVDRKVDGLYLSIFSNLYNFRDIKFISNYPVFSRSVDAQNLKGVNWLKTAHLVGTPADLFGLTLRAVDHYTIVTKSVMPIAHACRKILMNSMFSSSF